MTTVIGLAPNDRGAAAVHLGSMLARSVSDDVVVVTVVPTPWPPHPVRIDAEYLALQKKAAEEALAAARTQIGADLSVELVTHSARSVSSGLLEVARERRGALAAPPPPASRSPTRPARSPPGSSRWRESGGPPSWLWGRRRRGCSGGSRSAGSPSGSCTAPTSR